MDHILLISVACVMNVISFEKAYCLYPKATFEERRSLICANEGPAHDAAIQKYIHRGWKMVYTNLDWAQEVRTSFHVIYHLVRNMGDRYCWTIPLGTINIPDRLCLGEGRPILTSDPASASSWRLAYEARHGGYMRFEVTCDHNLYLQYITSHGDMLRRLTQKAGNEYKTLMIIKNKK